MVQVRGKERYLLVAKKTRCSIRLTRLTFVRTLLANLANVAWKICERGQPVSVFLPNRRSNAALCERVFPSIGRFPVNLRPCRVNGLESLEGLYVYDRAFTGQGFFPSVGRLYPEICRVCQTNTLRLLSSCALVARWRRARAVPGAPFTGVDPSARWISLIVSRRFVPSNDRCILIRSPPFSPYDQPWVVRYLIKLIKRIETYWNFDCRKMARGILRSFLLTRSVISETS